MKTLDEFSRSSPLRGGAGVAVLVVDDEDAVRRFATRVLARDGYTVIEAQVGAEALELFQNGGVPPADFVVSDIVMPRLNGRSSRIESKQSTTAMMRAVIGICSPRSRSG